MNTNHDLQKDKELFARKIKKIVEIYGSDILKHDKQFMNVFNDITPKMDRE